MKNVQGFEVISKPFFVLLMLEKKSPARTLAYALLLEIEKNILKNDKKLLKFKNCCVSILNMKHA